ncbi:hypothetical protein [Streptomyces sp. FH025]|uniref:hypothetical protein n=1 Tax=Streptomyces sp. FH025 TaxID=2815937 RepID=UPI001A9CBFFF|nr:hypothetical protein [Streptomyces sp. FH025]MBO1414613.1 hypothetical protein [Streptomyces sp. FH025]
MTEQAARAQLLRHLTDTLRSLPPGSALARRHPDLPKAAFAAGTTSRYENDFADVEEVDGPASYSIAYWVVGAPLADSDRYFDLVLDAWRENNWLTQVSQDAPRAGYAETADGFTFALRQSIQGYLSLFSSTPRFWPGPDEGTPLPDHIDRPT